MYIFQSYVFKKQTTHVLAPTQKQIHYSNLPESKKKNDLKLSLGEYHIFFIKKKKDIKLAAQVHYNITVNSLKKKRT